MYEIRNECNALVSISENLKAAKAIADHLAKKNEPSYYFIVKAEEVYCTKKIGEI